MESKKEDTKQKGETFLTLSLLRVVANVDGMTQQVRETALKLQSDGTILLMVGEDTELLGYGDKAYHWWDVFRLEKNKLAVKLQSIENAYLYEDVQGRTWIFSKR
jgi:hypothetical protein